jgi:hypothetical protein
MACIPLPLHPQKVVHCSDDTENLLAKPKAAGNHDGYNGQGDNDQDDIPDRVELGDGWGIEVDPVTGRTFYYHEPSDQSQWTSPFDHE